MSEHEPLQIDPRKVERLMLSRLRLRGRKGGVVLLISPVQVPRRLAAL